jgi:hypothetical protein
MPRKNAARTVDVAVAVDPRNKVRRRVQITS